MTDVSSLPYRPAAAVMLLNDRSQVWVGQRRDSTLEAWQMPQGGLDEGEEPQAGALRELEEETGIAPHLVEIIARSERELLYDLPDDLIGKVWVDVAQSNPKVVYAQVEAKGAKGGLYRTNDGGATWMLVNTSQALRARPFYFNKVYVNPKDENEVYVTELSFHRSTDGGKTFVNVNTPHGDNHVMWINPDNPKIFIETNDGGANITVDNGRSWSTQMNQPTAELYMLDADEQFP